MYMRITMADGGTRCFDQKNKKDNKNNKNNKNNQVNIKSRSAEAKTSAGRDFDYRYFRSAAFCSGIRRGTAFQVSSIYRIVPARMLSREFRRNTCSMTTQADAASSGSP